MRLFVTAGTGLEPFDRLIAAVDDAIGCLGTPVAGTCQLGSTRHRCRHLANVTFLSRADFNHELDRADVVICHAGVGTIRAAIGHGHRPLVMARTVARGEVVNDHQLEIVAELGARGRILTFSNGLGLLELLRRPPQRHDAAPPPGPALARVARALSAAADPAPFPWLASVCLRLLALAAPPLQARPGEDPTGNGHHRHRSHGEPAAPVRGGPDGQRHRDR
jgi:UDP-N-acetylglucosamine transferase subunit ALG13